LYSSSSNPYCSNESVPLVDAVPLIWRIGDMIIGIGLDSGMAGIIGIGLDSGMAGIIGIGLDSGMAGIIGIGLGMDMAMLV
jgi:hypothetical protein